MLCIRQYLLSMSLFACVCNILMFCEFEIAGFLSLGEGVCSPVGFAPLVILNLLMGEFASLGVFCGFEFA